jgi:tol-pal system protein YbgF
MTYRQRVANVAVVIALSAFAALKLDVAQAQIFGGGNIAELQTQIDRLERDVRDLQMEVFRNQNVGAPTGATLSTQRVDDIEESLRRLTGNMEELMFELDQLSQRMDRMQNQLEFLERNQNAQALLSGPPQEGVQGELPPSPDMPGGQQEELALAPSEGVLGAIPQNTPLPTQEAPLQNDGLPPDSLPPFPGADPEAEFDAAMRLLTQAQYARAEEAFRAFSVAHPDTELGAQALYWTADIAYSVDRDYPGAARDFAELLRQYPDAPRAPEGMLKLGLSLLALGQKEEGCVTLAALPRTYPNATPSISERARTERSAAACA